MSPVRYELGFYIPEDDMLHSHGREDFKSYMYIINMGRYLRETFDLAWNIEHDIQLWASWRLWNGLHKYRIFIR
jgi:hypothetical protein